MTRALLLSLLLCGGAFAASGPPAALKAMASGEFERALRTLDKALAGADGRKAGELQLLRAQCLLALHKRDQARAALVGALEANPEAELDPEKANPELVALLRAVRESTTGHLSVSADAADSQVVLDGRLMGPPPLKVEVPVGRHRVALKTAEGTGEEQVVVVGSGSTASVSFAGQRAVSVAPPLVEVSPDRPVEPFLTLPAAQPEPSKASKLWLLPAIGGGVVAIAGAVSFGLSKGDAATLNSDKTLTDEQRSEIAGRGELKQTLGVAMMAGGAGLAAVGVAGLLLTGREDSAALSFAPQVTLGQSGFAVSGRW